MIHKTYPPATNVVKHAHINAKDYQEIYQRSIEQPENFWAEQAEHFLDWFKPWDTVMSGSFQEGNMCWFEGAELNVCHNCVDRHLPERANQTAIIWEGDEPNSSFTLSYQQLHQQVCRLANVFKKYGIKKGDRICIYMPMIPEAAVAMLACTRIGAVHSVVFGGFSAKALEDRILDSDCRLVITADQGVRGTKIIPLKNNVDSALQQCPNVKNVLVVKRTGEAVNWVEKRDLWYQDEMQQVDDACPAEPMQAEDPLFILYTSGSTGKPKGVVHTTAGYLLYAAITHRYVFDYHDGDVYWCTADIGWITGHSYIIYGPLANAATTLMFEGVPTYPDASRFWQVIDKHQVNIFYTAPTAIRALMSQGDDFVNKTSRSSLRLLGSVGEPINPEAWEWYYNIVGRKQCPIVDTWWQTETGGIMLSPLIGVSTLKPGAVMRPLFGIEPALLDEHCKPVLGKGQGKLVIAKPWPGMLRTVYGDHQRFMETYLLPCPNYYYTGDGASRDSDDDYHINGRIDDVMNISGHRIGTAEIESALGEHPKVAESAVIAIPHDVKGEMIHAFVIVKAGKKIDEALRQELIKLVASEVGAFAKPSQLDFVPDLPKTRSGKIMRRILRQIAIRQIDKLGDTSTLANPEVIDKLIKPL